MLLRPYLNKQASPWWFITAIPTMQEAWVGRSQSKASPRQKNVIFYLKNNLNQKELSHVVEHLPSKHEALSSSPSTNRKGRKERSEEEGRREEEGREGE
jgi:hypothetical protein